MSRTSRLIRFATCLTLTPKPYQCSYTPLLGLLLHLHTLNLVFVFSIEVCESY